METEIPTEIYAEIEALIQSDDSPVGIDAKKTHVLILHKLNQIEKRLQRLEAAVGGA
jgi:hypothetical protein